jgi:hypothetical protein
VLGVLAVKIISLVFVLALNFHSQQASLFLNPIGQSPNLKNKDRPISLA